MELHRPCFEDIKNMSEVLNVGEIKGQHRGSKINVASSSSSSNQSSTSGNSSDCSSSSSESESTSTAGSKNKQNAIHMRSYPKASFDKSKQICSEEQAHQSNKAIQKGGAKNSGSSMREFLRKEARRKATSQYRERVRNKFERLAAAHSQTMAYLRTLDNNTDELKSDSMTAFKKWYTRHFGNIESISSRKPGRPRKHFLSDANPSGQNLNGAFLTALPSSAVTPSYTLQNFQSNQTAAQSSNGNVGVIDKKSQSCSPQICYATSIENTIEGTVNEAAIHQQRSQYEKRKQKGSTKENDHDHTPKKKQVVGQNDLEQEKAAPAFISSVNYLAPPYGSNMGHVIFPAAMRPDGEFDPNQYQRWFSENYSGVAQVPFTATATSSPTGKVIIPSHPVHPACPCSTCKAILFQHSHLYNPSYFQSFQPCYIPAHGKVTSNMPT